MKKLAMVLSLVFVPAVSHANPCVYLASDHNAFMACMAQQSQDFARHTERQHQLKLQTQGTPSWERRQPCNVYHHEGYLGGPEQPDSISVFDRNC